MVHTILELIKTIKKMDMALFIVQMEKSFFKVFGKMIILKRWIQNSNEKIFKLEIVNNFSIYIFNHLFK
jgi:hypothetical protein